MGSRDARIDAYIDRSAAFAQPILNHLRETVHTACPEVEETLKWGSPHFTYKGMLCSMAAFKQHCAFGFWKGKLVVGSNEGTTEPAMGQFGRIGKRSDLPAKKALIAMVKKAMQLNEAGIKLRPARKPARLGPRQVPNDLQAALQRNRKAKAHFLAFSPSKQREYIDWITEAKRAETRIRRLDTALEWLAEGKSRNWKYAAC